jgi:hypothetical protein
MITILPGTSRDEERVGIYTIDGNRVEAQIISVRFKSRTLQHTTRIIRILNGDRKGERDLET